MSVPYVSPISLWILPGYEFNEWRASNDLPLLYRFFLGRLPHFKEWLDLFHIDEALFCRVVPTGALFTGENRKLIVREPSAHLQNTFYRHRPVTAAALERKYRELGQPVPAYLEFEPYFAWARRMLGRKRFFSLDLSNESRIDTFVFNRWLSHNAPERSRAVLLGDFEVLKLGGTVLSKKIYLGERNLDFADLDHLVIRDNEHGHGAVEVSFSSCRHLTFSGAHLHHFDFRHCDLDRLRCEGSELSHFSFRSCGGKRIQFIDSRLHKVSFLECALFPDFSKCELTDLVFLPGKDQFPSGVSDEYRRLRILAQDAGNRGEASKYYYLERKYERKALFSPYAERPALFPPKGYGGRVRDIASGWWKGETPAAVAFARLSGVFLFHLSLWLHPRTGLRALSFRMRYLASLFEEIIWGYGEKPLRVFLTAFCVICFYAVIYFSLSSELSESFRRGDALVNSIYFSVVTFTTLGYGDIMPRTGHLKLICSTEALLGCFTMGLFIAGFSNKSRY